jgi:hypothetical protein
MKGGDSPKPKKRRNAEVKFGSSDRGIRPLKRRKRHTDQPDFKSDNKKGDSLD